MRSLSLILVLIAGCSGSNGDADGGDDDGGAIAIDAGKVDGGGRDDAGPVEDAGDAGNAVECGSVTCPSGQVCCNESCGICTEPGGSCIEIACVDAGMDGGGAPVPCGSTFCASGMVCCNPSCGICTEPGGSCIEIACVDAGSADAGMASCAPMDATGVGACLAFWGYKWDGTNCVGVSGCSCAGTDCGALYSEPDPCLAAHAGCASSDTFACGDAMRCRSYEEYCSVFYGGPAGSEPVYSCNMLPDSCRALSAPMCSNCFPRPGPGGGDCTDNGPGQMTVSYFAP